MKILVVDDDEFVRTMVVGVLEEAGHEVRDENNVDSAMAALKEGGFEFLVTDIVMPNKDGGHLMMAVKKAGLDIPILAITGGFENAQDDYQHYADLFADETLMKPVKKDELLATIERLAASRK